MLVRYAAQELDVVAGRSRLLTFPSLLSERVLVRILVIEPVSIQASVLPKIGARFIASAAFVKRVERWGR